MMSSLLLLLVFPIGLPTAFLSASYFVPTPPRSPWLPSESAFPRSNGFAFHRFPPPDFTGKCNLNLTMNSKQQPRPEATSDCCHLLERELSDINEEGEHGYPTRTSSIKTCEFNASSMQQGEREEDGDDTDPTQAAVVPSASCEGSGNRMQQQRANHGDVAAENKINPMQRQQREDEEEREEEEVPTEAASSSRAECNVVNLNVKSNDEGTAVVLTAMSKNAMRKLRAQQRLEEIKEKRKTFRPIVKRRKKMARRELAAALNDQKAKLETKNLNTDAGIRVRVCIDCEFEELQCESEIFSLVQQLMYAYGEANRLNRLRDKAKGIRRRWKSGWRGVCKKNINASPMPAADNAVSDASNAPIDATCEDLNDVNESASTRTSESSTALAKETSCFKGDSSLEDRVDVEFCVAGVGPKVQEALKRVQSNGRWKCDVSALPFHHKFATECAEGQAVYLTADANEELETLDENTVYIVGGLVDRNRYKGLTLKRSTERGIRAAKLPIASKLGRKLMGSKILTVNQVVAILIAYAELGDWTSALARVLPPRKAVTNDSPTGSETRASSPLETNVLLEE